MKKILISTLLTILFSANLFAQKEKYPSKEEDEYYKNLDRNYVPFKPLEKSVIENFKSENYEIHSLNNYTPYNDTLYLTPYQKERLEKQFEIFSKRDSVEERFNKFLSEIEYIGKIDRTQILKYEKNDSIEAFIYGSYEFDKFSWSGESPGIWIAYSENSGSDWNYYYTGITQEQPVFVKFYSQRPLIREKGKLEIEACLLRQLSPFSHPVANPSYECVKDGIYIIFDIDFIAKDSDGDGLTDIVEDKLYTDKFNKDTNGDGVPDNLDTNPRLHYPRTEKSKIYEAILNEKIDWNEKNGTGKLLFSENTAYFVTDSTETILIVTDNEDLMGIQPEKYRVIFMTPEEYQNNSKTYQTELNDMDFSPLFKVNNKKNTYKMTYSYKTWGSTYLIKKTKKGWTIQMISTWIS